MKQEKQAVNCQKLWDEIQKGHFDLSARFCMMISLYFPFNYPIFVSPEHTLPFRCLPHNHHFLFTFLCHIPPPSPADAPTRGLIPAPSSSNRWNEQEDRNHRINQVIKLQRCNIKQRAPLPLPSLLPPPGLDGNGCGWVGGGGTWHDGQRCCWFPQRLSTHSCWVNNSDPCLIKITDHPPLRKRRQFENYSN